MRRPLYESIKQVKECIDRNPGIHQSAISKKCRLNAYATQDILQALIDYGMITQIKEGHTRYYPQHEEAQP
jgi:predicted transcriptional regulator